MKGSKTKKPATAKRVNDLPVDTPQEIKGGIIIHFYEPKAIIDDGKIDYRTDDTRKGV